MAAGFNLEPDEAVIKRKEKVGYGSGPFVMNSSELILTTKNLVLLQKNLFGQVKDTVRFPLRDIRIVNGEAQVLLGKADGMNSTLDVYMAGGMESFRFDWDSEVNEWIDSISELLTGKKPERDDDAWVAETLAMAENVAGTVKKMKSAFGIRDPEAASGRCTGCGASISGFVGETTACPYCGTKHTF